MVWIYFRTGVRIMSNFAKLMQQAAAGSAGGDFYPYTIDNSARLEGNNYLYRTWGGSNQTFTLSFWVKRATGGGNTPGYFQVITGGGYYSPGGFYFLLWPNTAGGRWISQDDPAYESIFNDPSSTGRDFSAWYHYVFAFDSTQSTSTDRMKVWVNGVQQPWTGTYPSQNYSIPQFTGTMYIGRDSSTGQSVQFAGGGNSYGYLADIAITDGQYYSASDFGEFKNGAWVPKDLSGLNFGTKGFWLDFKDSSNFGNDVSGNNLDFTAVGFQTHDQMLDTPTNNFNTVNPLYYSPTVPQPAPSEGNLRIASNILNTRLSPTTFKLPLSGKYYWEIYIDGTPNSSNYVGISNTREVVEYNNAQFPGQYAGLGHQISGTTTKNDGANITYGVAQSNGNIYQVAIDMGTGKAWFGSNNTWFSSGDPANGTNPGKTFTDLNVIASFATYSTGCKYDLNFGQNGTFNGKVTAQGNADANGVGDFYYAPPTGFLATCTANFPEPTIGPNSATQSDENFNTVLYTGNGSSQNVTGFGFNPDMVWHKSRSLAYSHSIVDVIRGNSNVMFTNSTDAEQNPGAQLDLITDGATVTYRSANLANNQSGATYVIWGWKGNGSGVSNTDGSITSTVSANTKAGFSIVTYTGTGAAATVGHGLGVKPALVIAKGREVVNNWLVWHQDLTGEDYYLHLETTGAPAQNSAFFSAFSTTTFSLGNSAHINSSTKTNIAYCFAEVEGFSKFGKYTGNGSTDGPFIYTGFRPAFVLVKAYTSGSAEHWRILDAERNTYNTVNSEVYPNLSNAEGTGAAIDFLSNGFKLRASGSGWNYGTYSYIYMAFSEMPFKYSNAR